MAVKTKSSLQPYFWMLTGSFAFSWMGILASLAGDGCPWQVIAQRVSAPAAVASGERRVTLFARGTEGDLLVLQRDRGEWTAPRSLGIPLSIPRAVPAR